MEIARVLRSRGIARLALTVTGALLLGACNAQTPLSPSGTDSLSQSPTSGPSAVLTPGLTGARSIATGNCPGGTGDKDGTGPFSLSGYSAVVVKAGTECYGPIDVADGAFQVIKVGDTNCFIVEFDGDTVDVYNHPDHIGRICKGISHIESASDKCETGCEPPPCEDPKGCEPPPPPCEDPKGCEPTDPK
jgi:hypothetical protein